MITSIGTRFQASLPVRIISAIESVDYLAIGAIAFLAAIETPDSEAATFQGLIVCALQAWIALHRNFAFRRGFGPSHWVLLVGCLSTQLALAFANRGVSVAVAVTAAVSGLITAVPHRAFAGPPPRLAPPRW